MDNTIIKTKRLINVSEAQDVLKFADYCEETTISKPAAHAIQKAGVQTVLRFDRESNKIAYLIESLEDVQRQLFTLNAVSVSAFPIQG